MTRWIIIPALLCLQGCFLFAPPPPEPPDAEPVVTAVDEACLDSAVGGDPSASSSQQLGVSRLNCHRVLAGLAPVGFDPALNDAAQAHADYIVATDEFGHVESQPAHPAYTGDRAPQRVDAAGFELDASVELLSEVVGYFSDGSKPASAVDVWMSNVYHREPLMAPVLDSAGFGSAGLFDVMLMVGPWEPDAGVESAVYPADGQWGVPTAFDSDTEAPDPAPTRGVVGYPVSITFLAPLASGNGTFDVRADAASSLVGPDGAVAADVLSPANDAALLRSVFLVPHAPLEPATTYEATVSGSVAGAPFAESWSFTTAE